MNILTITSKDINKASTNMMVPHPKNSFIDSKSEVNPDKMFPTFSLW